MRLAELRMTTAGADEGQAGESSHKRKREPGLDGEKDVKRKYDLDTDILDCSICLERFSTPVYQVLTSSLHFFVPATEVEAALCFGALIVAVT